MVVKKTPIRISGNEIMYINDSNIYHCYVDLWKGPSERYAMAYQGIGKYNMLKHSIGAADAATNGEDQAIATAFGKKDFVSHWTLNC